MTPTQKEIAALQKDCCEKKLAQAGCEWIVGA